MNFEQLPAFIPAAVPATPLNFIWKGHMAHIGPVDQSAPLMKKLGNTTMLAEVTLCAGISLWGGWRLKNAIDTTHFMELAQAAFAYCIDWRYLDLEAGPKDKAPEFPIAISASRYLHYLMRRAMHQETYWHSTFVPLSETFHSVHLVRHMLDEAACDAFDEWLDEVVYRMRKYAPRQEIQFRAANAFKSQAAYDEYYQPARGVPFPPQFLDTTADYNNADRIPLLQQFLSTLDHKKNRYLRSPQEMLALGFKGTPYEFTPPF